MIQITVNGRDYTTLADADTPLLYVLRNDLGLTATKFGCGLAQCGVCAVLVDREEIRSFVTSVGDVAGRKITTLEGLPGLWSESRRKAAGDAAPATLHPIQDAWIAEQVPQCGYCQPGMMILAASFLDKVPDPTEDQIRVAFDGHICRCGSYMRIIRAVRRAAVRMAETEGDGNSGRNAPNSG